MPRPSAFPKDDNGSYVTLSLLKNMPNGELVQVYWVKTDIMELIIPSSVVQDGPSSNLDEFKTRIYFKQQKNVTVGYVYNMNNLQKRIELDNLKKVGSSCLEKSRRDEVPSVFLSPAEFVGFPFFS